MDGFISRVGGLKVGLYGRAYLVTIVSNTFEQRMNAG